MRFLLPRLALILAFAFQFNELMAAQAPAAVAGKADAPAATARVESAADNPVADEAAQVMVGNARFTVLTSKLIRMEWSAAGKFEDHASLVFINRRLPVPKFTHSIAGNGGTRTVTIKTEALTLTYKAAGDGRFTPDSLSIQLTVAGKLAVWRPGLKDDGNLQGTTRTLDGARGTTREPIEDGLVSRSGWVVVDDTARPLFDSY